MCFGTSDAFFGHSQLSRDLLRPAVHESLNGIFQGALEAKRIERLSGRILLDYLGVP